MGNPDITKPLTQQEANDIAVEAYVYFYPMVLMDVTRKVLTNVPPGAKEGYGPMNLFSHMRKFPEANFRDVVRPNFDTLYSIAWLDLTKEPVIVSVLDTNNRYYLLPMLDMWTDVIAAPGKRTSGTGAQEFVVVPNGWKGDLPNGLTVINSTTKYLWIIGRTQTNGPKDYELVHKVQDGYKITLLSDYGKIPGPVKFTPDATVDMKTPPMTKVDTMSGEKYFSYAAELMKFHSPHITDWSQLERIKRLGIEAGKGFDFNGANETVKTAMEYAVKAGLNLMKEKIPTLANVVNGWQMLTENMGVYGNSYLKRAVIALAGLGANQPEDAIYPLNTCDSDGNPIDGNNDYVIHFSKEILPPVGAFWSITMYDAEGYQAANELNRFAIGDRDDLKYNADGSLDIYIQNKNPGAEKVNNWLPSPLGLLGITMRLYAPKAEIVNGLWKPPAIKKVK